MSKTQPSKTTQPKVTTTPVEPGPGLTDAEKPELGEELPPYEAGYQAGAANERAGSHPDGKAPPATVRAVGDWRLVTHGTWEVSVGPDGLLMLPRHLHPRELEDFITAARTAAKVGADIIAANTQKTENDKLRGVAPRGHRAVTVTEGAPPAGTTRMRVSQQQAAATIGRPRRGQRPAQTTTSSSSRRGR